MIDVLADSGIDVNRRAKGRWSALQMALIKGTAGTVKSLLHYGAHVNQAGPGGWTARHLVSKIGRRDFIEMLVTQGASLT